MRHLVRMRLDESRAGRGARKITGHLPVVDGGLSAINQNGFLPPPGLL